MKSLQSKINVPKSKNKKKIAFVTLGGSAGMYIDVFLAMILRKRGHDITFFIEDECMPLFEIHDFKKPSTWYQSSKNGFFQIKQILKKLNFNYIGFSETIINNNSFDINNYDLSLNSSLLRHYRVGILNDELEDLQKRTELFSKTISISHDVGNYINNNEFDITIMNHGLYSSTGPCREYLVKNGKKVLTHDQNMKKDSYHFVWGDSSDNWYVDKPWNDFKSKKLDKNQEKILDIYLESRRDHSSDRRKYNFSIYENKNKLINSINLDPKKKIYTLFTNVLWDAASADKDVVFKNPLEWVIQTVKWFSLNEDLQLIIKIHPAETVIGTQQKFSDTLKKHVEIPKNVKIIKPDAKTNSWSFMNATDVGIVHTSTVGLELVISGVPCIVVSKTHYRGKGFTIDIKNKKDYFQTLKDPSLFNFNNSKIISLARKYTYFCFEKYQYRIPIFKVDNNNNIYEISFSKKINEVSNDIYKKIESFNYIINE